MMPSVSSPGAVPSDSRLLLDDVISEFGVRCTRKSSLFHSTEDLSKRDLVYHETSTGWKIYATAQVEKFRSIHARYVQSCDPYATESDRCDDSSRIPRPCPMQSEETRASTAHSLSVPMPRWPAVPLTTTQRSAFITRTDSITRRDKFREPLV